MEANTAALVAIGAALGIIVSALTIRKMVLSIVDARIDERADRVVTGKLAPVLQELQELTSVLSNGIQSKVSDHTIALEKQNEKLDALAAGQARMTGRLEAYIELTTTQRS